MRADADAKSRLGSRNDDRDRLDRDLSPAGRRGQRYGGAAADETEVTAGCVVRLMRRSRPVRCVGVMDLVRRGRCSGHRERHHDGRQEDGDREREPGDA